MYTYDNLHYNIYKSLYKTCFFDVLNMRLAIIFVIIVSFMETREHKRERHSLYSALITNSK